MNQRNPKPRYINAPQVTRVQAPAQQQPVQVLAPAQEARPTKIYGICGHLAKSPFHSCGCDQYYGY